MGPWRTVLEADYLVVGAGAAGMAFTDALIDHADVSVVMVDRRHGAGGHWLDAYPFVRLHQASAFYGVASTLLGSGRIQQDGPEAGLHERATAPEICAYYDRVLRERMIRSGKVTFHPNCEYLGERQFVSRVSGQQYRGARAGRVVDAHYIAPEIPATTPAPFGVAEEVRVVAVNDLVDARRGAVAVRRSSGRARPPPTRASGCSTTASTRTPSAGCGRAIRGCSTGRWCSPTRRSSSAWPPTSWRQRPQPASPDDMFLRLEEAGRHAAHRPVRDAHDGQDADARAVGARPAAHHRARRPSRPRRRTSSRAGWCSARAR